jgi:mannobiose 2-epimerase
MAAESALYSLRAEMESELTRRILPYWMYAAQDPLHRGTLGLVAEDGTPSPGAPKGCILHARVLWTFSAAHRCLGGESYRAATDRAAAYFTMRFVDPVHGGVYWMLGEDGRRFDDRKHVYAQAFAIYALAEHHRATGEEYSLRLAIAIFRLVESHAFDAAHVGYEECFARDWTALEDVRLSEVDLNERRSMNTHLHLLEAYTTLYAVWPDASLAARLRTLIELFLDRIIAPDGSHVVGFFDERWQPRSAKVSYGHDIETSWLLLEAAAALGDGALAARVEVAALRLARAVLEHGVDREHGGVFYERVDDRLDTDKEWWPQTEAIVGFIAAYQLSGDASFVDAAHSTWRFVARHMLDRRHGEWLRRVTRAGDRSLGGEKVGPWKCPYHNGRACLEVMARVDALLRGAGGSMRRVEMQIPRLRSG